MPSPTDFPTPGKVIAVKDDGRTVVFAPRGTAYELHLKTAAPYAGPINTPIEAFIRLTARKVYTVPSGGNFVVPIMGPPRIVQGRVRYADERQLVLKASGHFIVDLPPDDSAIDLDSGPIGLNKMVNVVALPGAMFELASSAAAVATSP